MTLVSRNMSGAAWFDGRNERRASGYIDGFIAQTTKLANCKSGATCPDGGAALNRLNAKGVELNNWMNGLIVP